MVEKKRNKNQKPKQIPLPDIKTNIRYPIIIAVIGFLLYTNTIKHDYVLDDVGAITGNEFVLKGLKGIPEIIKNQMWHFDNVNLGYYRPLSLITFAIENQFFPNNPHISHLGNVLLYALTGFFVCLLLMDVFRNLHPAFAFIVSLLFIAHPIHTEVVANIKSRDEILAFLNLTIALFLLIQTWTTPKTNTKFLILSMIFFYLALLSKETAMSGLLIAPLILFFTHNFSIKEVVLKVIPLLIVVLLFQAQKYSMIGTLSGEIPKDIVNYPYADAGMKISSTFLIFLYCIRLIIFPYPLSYDYSYNEIPAVGFNSITVILGFVFACLLAYIGLKGIKNKSITSFGILFFCITLAPTLAFVSLRGGILAERFLYAPSLGFCIIIVWLIGFKLQESKFSLTELKAHTAILSVLTLVFLLYSIKTIARNTVWMNNFTLFSTDVKTSSNSCQVRRHYGSELINMSIAEKDPQKKQDLLNQGITQLREALKINSHFGDAFFKLGVAYQTTKLNPDSIIYYYTRAIQEAPGYAISYNNLGILYEGLGKQELASYYYNKAAEVNPFFAEGIRNRDNHHKKTELDIRIYPSSTNLDSLEHTTPEQNRDFHFYYKLGTDYASKGDYANAAKSLEKSVALNSEFIDALVNLSNCYGMLKQYNKNIEILNKVLKISPNNIQALSNLAITYQLMGDTKKSEEYRDKARKLAGQ